MINKLDPHLRTRFTSLPKQPGKDAAKEVPAEARELTELLVEFTGDIADLKAVGFIPSRLRKNPSGRIKLSCYACEHHRDAPESRGGQLR